MGTIGLLISIFFITSFILIVGGGVGYWLYKRSRKPKETYKAYVYQLSQGKRVIRNKNGDIISKIRLRDLQPFSVDVLERVEVDTGVIRYRLQKLNKPTPQIGNNTVEFWGKKEKIVNVLFHDGACTLLEKGYDESTASQIYHPIPYDRINVVKDELTEKLSQIDPHKKDILQAVAPYAVAIISLMMIVAIAYFSVEGMIKISDNMEKASKTLSKSMEKIAGVDPETVKNRELAAEGSKNKAVPKNVVEIKDSGR